MRSTQCVRRRPGRRVVVIDEDLLGICEGHVAASAILRYFEYLHSIRREEQAESRARAEASGAVPDEADWWHTRSQAAIKEALLGVFGEKKIAEGLGLLLQKKFLVERRNPADQWDQTRQYWFAAEQVQVAIMALGEDDSDDPGPDCADVRTEEHSADLRLVHSADMRNVDSAKVRLVQSAKVRREPYKESIETPPQKKERAEAPSPATDESDPAVVLVRQVEEVLAARLTKRNRDLSLAAARAMLEYASPGEILEGWQIQRAYYTQKNRIYPFHYLTDHLPDLLPRIRRRPILSPSSASARPAAPTLDERVQEEAAKSEERRQRWAQMGLLNSTA